MFADGEAVEKSFNRREIVVGGSTAALGLLVLGGCRSGGGGASASTGMDLPGPMWPSNTARPVAPVRTTPFPTQPTPLPAGAVFAGVIDRSAWTNAGIARPREINALGRVTRITIHHDGMNAFTTTSQEEAARRLELIRLSHVNKRGWADIGYHFVIDPAGRVWAGRSTQYQGAHVSNQNENNLGIMCLGNYERQTPTSATLNTLSRFVASMMRMHNVPLTRVYTHRELDQTECPGRNLQPQMVRMRQRGGALALALVEMGAGELAMA